MTLGRGEGNPPSAFDFGKYLDGLFGYALVLSRNRAEAEDLVQETCLRALGAMERLHSESNVKGWLFTILRNIWLNELRRRRTTPEMVELDSDAKGVIDPPDTSKDPHAIYVGELVREQVRAAIGQLPVEFREVIMLREYEELSYQEIAAVLDCPPGTVMSRLARARSKLRELLPRLATTPPSQEKDEGRNGEAVA